jgi:hypothetical protein
VQNCHTYCSGELSARPLSLIPANAYDPTSMVIKYIWVSKKVQLDLNQHIYEY